MNKIILLLIISTLTMLASDINIEMQESDRLYSIGEFKKSAEIRLRLSLEEDSSLAKSKMGDMLIRGIGVDQDCKKGIMFIFAGIKDECLSFKYLSEYYAKGMCAKQNAIKSKKYIKKYKKCLNKI